MSLCGSFVKRLKALDFVVTTFTVGLAAENVPGRRLGTYRTDSISLCPKNESFKFIAETLIRIVRLLATGAKQLHFLSVFETNLKRLFHGVSQTSQAGGVQLEFVLCHRMWRIHCRRLVVRLRGNVDRSLSLGFP